MSSTVITVTFSICVHHTPAGKEEGTKWVQVDGIVDKLSVSISGTVWAIMHDKV